jgi:hypothetical protein
MKSIVKNLIERFQNRHPKLFFLHIAKCGGISINRALRYRYGLGYNRLNSLGSVRSVIQRTGSEHLYADQYEEVHLFRDSILQYLMNSETPFISGHYSNNAHYQETAGAEYVYMTLFREPVDRLLSSYYFNSAKEEDSPWKIRLPLEEYLESDEARYHGSDYVRLLAGITHYDLPPDTMFEKAVANLDRFQIIGVIEHSDRLEKRIQEVLGFRIRLGHKNANLKRKSMDQIDPVLLERAKVLCEPNTRLYQHVLSRLGLDGQR